MSAIAKIETAQKLLQRYSELSYEQLYDFEMYPELDKKEARARVKKDMTVMGIRVIENEVRIPTGKWTKTQIADAIYKETEPYRAQKLITEELSPEQSKNLLGDVDNLKLVKQEQPELADLAEKLYKHIVNYAESLWLPNEGKYSRDNSNMFTHPANTVNSLRKFTNTKGDFIAAATIKNTYMRTIKKFVREEIEKHSYHNRHLEETKRVANELLGYTKEENNKRTYVRGFIDNLLQTESEIIRNEANEKHTNSKLQPSQVNVKTLIDQANEVLDNLKDEDSKTKWRDVAIALMVVTGRRSSEIMSSAIFEPTDKENWVKFTGQLKTKGRKDFDGSYEIPLLANPLKVIYALNWLEKKNKRMLPTNRTQEAVEKAAKICNGKFSKELNQTAHDWDVYLNYKFRGDIDSKEEGVIVQKPSRLTCKMFRELYLLTVSQLFGKGEMPSLLISRYAGHRDNDNKTFDHYMTHYIILDIERVRSNKFAQ